MQKIRAKTSSDRKLVKKCEEKTGIACSDPVWEDYNNVEIVPKNNTVAIFIKVSKSSGVVYIYEEGTDEYKDKVGQDEDNTGSTVIVPWGQGLKFVCYGRCRVALVTAKEIEQNEVAGDVQEEAEQVGT